MSNIIYPEVINAQARIALYNEQKDFISVNVERRTLVLQWLNIYGYSDRDLLLHLVNSKGSSGYRFIANLVKKRYIQPFKNVHFKRDVFMLDKAGLGELIELGIVDPEETKLPNKRKFMRSPLIPHDLGLQRVSLHILLGLFAQPIVEIVKDASVNGLRVDTLITLQKEDTGKLTKFAIEYERTDKSRQRAEYLLLTHIENIGGEEDAYDYGYGDDDDDDKIYDYLFIYFDNLKIARKYLKYILEGLPYWHKSRKTNALTRRYSDEKLRLRVNRHSRSKIYFGYMNGHEQVFLDSVNTIKNDKDHPVHLAKVNDFKKYDEKSLKNEIDKITQRIRSLPVEVQAELSKTLHVEPEKQPEEDEPIREDYQYDDDDDEYDNDGNLIKKKWWQIF